MPCFRQGCAALGLQDPFQTQQRTEKYLKLSLNQSPTDLQVLYTLAKTYVSMEQYKNAMTYYSQIVKMQDVKPLWIYEQGILYYENSDYKNALTAFNNALAHGYEPGNDFNENLATSTSKCIKG